MELYLSTHEYTSRASALGVADALAFRQRFSPHKLRFPSIPSMASTADIKVASLAAGFTLGFGVLTVWEAIKQTRRNRNPLRSTYIYMLWGEIIANLVIGILGWFFLNGQIGPTIPVLMSILVLWVFEVQLLLQIIVNRIAIIAENAKTIFRIKWGTAAIITSINIAVFCIWIPAHMNPPVSQTYVNINFYWDRVSKVLILIVDAFLNWYFLRTVKLRLVQQHKLKKYEPLVGFNAKLMIVSIAMDVRNNQSNTSPPNLLTMSKLMLIGLMSFPNQIVYIQFHPVAYMVKLNIEMSMAKLITRLARRQDNDMTDSHHRTNERSGHDAPSGSTGWGRPHGVELTQRSRIVAEDPEQGPEGSLDNSDDGGIRKKTEFVVEVETKRKASSQGSAMGDHVQHVDDEIPLTANAGHPKDYQYGNDDKHIAFANSRHA
ncbi:hypothetical protein HJFPF1_05479 [Paramyrothecium foliicola]|nr:hypothetical protein HJFPF1_05479 [Paramyrothecium foliicola]